MATFAYRGRTAGGGEVSGTLEAADEAAARAQLAGMQVTADSVGAVETRRVRGLRGDEFVAFNQQLAHLTAAGLPVEQGLRLMAQEMGSARMAGTIRVVVGELEAGHSLPEAIERHQGAFPRLYGQLVEAGIKTSNLPGMLLNLSAHQELVARVREGVWRALAYPIMVLVGLMVVLGFLSMEVVPKFKEIFNDFRTSLPWLTETILWLGDMYVYVAGGFLVVMVLVAAWVLAERFSRVRPLQEAVTAWMPILGSILRRSETARWCDALRMGVEGGLDLPRAMELAGGAVGSRGVLADTEELVGLVRSGQRMDGYGGGRVLPATVGVTLQLAADRHDLPGALEMLTEMYEQQAQHYARTLPAILTPFALALTAAAIGVVVLGLFLPLVRLVQSVS